MGFLKGTMIVPVNHISQCACIFRQVLFPQHRWRRRCFRVERTHRRCCPGTCVVGFEVEGFGSFLARIEARGLQG